MNFQTMLSFKPCIIWLTGYSGAGKSTIASALEQKLLDQGLKPKILDGDTIRKSISRDLSFNQQDRAENMRRVSDLAYQDLQAGHIVLCAFISPFRHNRRLVREKFKQGDFIEVFVDTPLAVCEHRDVKGLYQKARAGIIRDFTGIDSPYEKPLHPDIHLKNDTEYSADQSAEKIISYLLNRTFHQSSH